MIIAALLLSGRDWLLPVAGLLGGALILLWWNYRNAPAQGNVKIACSVLKTLGLLALAACLLEPLWSGERARPGANFIAVVADNSQGMQIKDAGAEGSRADQLRAMLDPNKSKWQVHLKETFQARQYVVDARLQSSKDFVELDFTGRASALNSSLKTLASRYKGQPLAGVLLFTDGNTTDADLTPEEFAALPPIYPVVIGRDAEGRDVALQKISANQTAFEDAPVTIQADALASGFTGGSVTARLIEVPRPEAHESTPKSKSSKSSSTNATSAKPLVTEQLITAQTLKPRRDGDVLSFRFQLRPERRGISFYRVELAAQSGVMSEATNSTDEVTLANNSRMVVVDRGAGLYRILYVSGRPNWDFKFLNRALAEDDQVELSALIRIAKKEPKFEFLGRRGEAANPLFRGFDLTDETTERHDQPVLVRVNTRDDAELRDGFPKTAEELFKYHAVVLDDLESEFFTRDQMTLLQKFASERGGGFLMLGGQESFNQGNYTHTPVGDMLPVYLDRIGVISPVGNLKLSITREGWLQPWVRLRDTESAEHTRLDTMPVFHVVNRSRDIKPGANVLATVSDPRGTQLPALVVQRYGFGKVGALLIGDMWRWGMHRDDERDDLGKSWRQTMRWLVTDVPGRIAFQAEPKSGDPNHALQLQVRARNEKYQPLDNSTVNVTVTALGSAGSSPRKQPSSNEKAAPQPGIHLRAEPALKEAGLSEATFVPRDPGAYLAEATVVDGSGTEVGRAEVGWAVDFAADEFKSLKPNRDYLANLAKKTGGELVEAGQLDRFVDSLPNRKAPVTEPWTYPLWHTPLVFLFALACFGAEWGLRRWKGLA